MFSVYAKSIAYLTKKCVCLSIHSIHGSGIETSTQKGLNNGDAHL